MRSLFLFFFSSWYILISTRNDDRLVIRIRDFLLLSLSLSLSLHHRDFLILPLPFVFHRGYRWLLNSRVMPLDTFPFADAFFDAGFIDCIHEIENNLCVIIKSRAFLFFEKKKNWRKSETVGAHQSTARLLQQHSGVLSLPPPAIYILQTRMQQAGSSSLSVFSCKTRACIRKAAHARSKKRDPTTNSIRA